MNSTKKGYTTMELLIVIAIVGILTTVIIIFVSAGRAKGRDAQRMSDIQQINTAIAYYIMDNGVAPDIFAVDKEESWKELSDILTPAYIPNLPVDPCVSSSRSSPGECTISDGGTNGNWLTYVYKGPSRLISEGTEAYIGRPVDLTMYVIMAENLESKKNTSFGFGPSSF